MGYELAPGHQGQGIANEMINPVIEFAFNTAGYKMIEACVHRENTKSKNLLLRNNFKSDITRKDEKNADNIFFTLGKY